MRQFLFITFCCFTSLAQSQAPAGYYSSASGMEGEALRMELENIIDGHSVQSYSSVWIHFQATDQKSNGEVWDMYSDNPSGPEPFVFEFGDDQCGNYGGEGDCYNREHSFPKSWFGDQSPMNSDLFHLYPTDGYVNGIRGNYPFGEVGSANYVSENGTLRGTCIYPGYNGIVFEPIDEYKGDFARSYFYMVTRYLDQVDNWNSPMLEDDGFSDWAINLLLEWSAIDPVSQKEIDRNNAVYTIQGNRNPFIDNPDFVTLIWGDPVCLFYDCGCVDEAACNYDPDAEIASETCDYSCYGCTDNTACNYDPQAELSDESCVYPGDPCEEGTDSGEEPLYDENCDCVVIEGCTNPNACNYEPEAQLDDGSCLVTQYCPCAPDINGDEMIDTSDLLILISFTGCQQNCGGSDLDLNGNVNTNDVLIFLSNFGQSCSY